MLDPAVVRAFTDLGLSGALLIGIWAFATGRVLPRRSLDDDRTHQATDVAELRKDRDEWKAIATTAVAKLDRVGDLLEDLLRNAK